MTGTSPTTVSPAFAEEHTHLSGTVHAMLRQIEAWEDRERTNGADLETSMVMADTAGEHAAMLSPHVHRPYFGSLTVRIAGKVKTLYVGNHAFADLKGPHSVISWESGVGGLFYSAELCWTTARGLGGRIQRRRQLDISHKTLHRVTDLYNEEGGETGGRETVLLTRLAEAATAGMRNVIETLQPEQNEILRARAGQNLAIQGPAGSGKTTLLYHRLAWLMHPERGEHQVTAEGCLVLMPNQVLAAYSRRILPGLKLEGVTVTTPEAWATSFLGIEKLEIVDRTLTLLLTDTSRTRRALAWRRAKAVGDLKMLGVVRQHLRLRFEANVSRLNYHSVISTSRGEISVSLDTPALQGILERVFAADPIGGLRRALRSALEDEVRTALRLSEGEALSVLRQISTELTAVTGKMLAGVLPVMDARKLLGDEATLRRAAAGLLDERTIQLLLGDPLSAIARPRRSHADVTEVPIMLAISALMDGLGRRVGRELEPYSHVALDESQDYPPLLYALLTRAVRPGHITALGDANQGIHGYKSVSSFRDMQSALAGASLMTLAKTYRSTRQITELCAAVAATYNRSGAIVGVAREGLAVLRLSGGDLATLTAQAVRAMQEAGHTNIAIVTRRLGEAERLQTELQQHDVDAQGIFDERARYQGQVVILPVNLAKGLEFDACIVAGADAEHYDPDVEYEARLLYVSTSRGMHGLALVAEQALHPLLELTP